MASGLRRYLSILIVLSMLFILLSPMFSYGVSNLQGIKSAFMQYDGLSQENKIILSKAIWNIIATKIINEETINEEIICQEFIEYLTTNSEMVGETEGKISDDSLSVIACKILAKKDIIKELYDEAENSGFISIAKQLKGENDEAELFSTIICEIQDKGIKFFEIGQDQKFKVFCPQNQSITLMLVKEIFGMSLPEEVVLNLIVRFDNAIESFINSINTKVEANELQKQDVIEIFDIIGIFHSPQVAIIRLRLDPNTAWASSLNASGRIFIVKDFSKQINDVNSMQDNEAMIISFWKTGSSVRVGLAEPSKYLSTLQIRKDISVDSITNNNNILEIKIAYDCLSGKWMAYANDVAINQINWNTVDPKKETDNILYCSDFSKNSTNPGNPAPLYPNDNGKLDFLESTPRKAKIMVSNSDWYTLEQGLFRGATINYCVPSSTPTPEPTPTSTPSPTPMPTAIQTPSPTPITEPVVSVNAFVDSSISRAFAITRTDDIDDAVKLVKQQTNENKRIIEINIDKTAIKENIKEVEIVLSKHSVNSISKVENAKVQIDAGKAVLTFDSRAVSKFNGATSSELSIKVNKFNNDELPDALKQTVKGRPVFEFKVKADNQEISTFGGGTAEISIPYELKQAENPEAIVVYYIDSSGNFKMMRSKFDKTDGTVKFKTSHFSKFAIGYNYVDFNDVDEKVWYNKAINFMAAREIIKGVGERRFMPDSNVTRADFVIMVMRSYGIEADTSIKDNFADAGNKYYTPYLAVAKKLGIANGVGNNKFLPEEKISRQDMMVMLYRALEKLGELPEDSGTKNLDSFLDKHEVSSYAREIINYFVKAGIVSGDGANVNPKGASTRAQAAQLLYNILSK